MNQSDNLYLPIRYYEPTPDQREEWRQAVGFNFYEVSNQGRVRSIDRTVTLCDGRVRFQRGRVLRPYMDGEGYPVVHVFQDAKSYTRKIHALVAPAFIGPRPEGLDVCHDDGNPGNNRPGNLRYATHVSNGADMVRHGRSTRGERHPLAKLTAEQVAAIRAMPGKQRDIAAVFGVSKGHISDIKNGKKWPTDKPQEAIRSRTPAEVEQLESCYFTEAGDVGRKELGAQS